MHRSTIAVFAILAVLTVPRGAFAQTEDGIFADVEPFSMEANYLAVERLEAAGYRDIHVVRRQPPTVNATDRDGNQVQIAIDPGDRPDPGGRPHHERGEIGRAGAFGGWPLAPPRGFEPRLPEPKTGSTARRQGIGGGGAARATSRYMAVVAARNRRHQFQTPRCRCSRFATHGG